MKAAGLVICFAFFSLLIVPMTVSAQDLKVTIGSWDTVRSLPLGTKLIVKTKNGMTYKGKLRQSADQVITIAAGKKNYECNRTGVLQIYRNIPKSRTRWVLIGAAIGGATAVASDAHKMAGYSTMPNEKWDPSRTAVISALSAGAGALVGYFFISGRDGQLLVYEAKP